MPTCVDIVCAVTATKGYEETAPSASECFLTQRRFTEAQNQVLFVSACSSVCVKSVALCLCACLLWCAQALLPHLPQEAHHASSEAVQHLRR